MSGGADCITADVKIHLGKRPLVAGDDDSKERGVEQFHPSKMDVLMHLLCVKSSTMCHINISVFMDAEEKGGGELKRCACVRVRVCACVCVCVQCSIGV